MCYNVNGGWLANRFSESETLRLRPTFPRLHFTYTYYLKGELALGVPLGATLEQPAGLCTRGTGFAGEDYVDTLFGLQ